MTDDTVPVVLRFPRTIYRVLAAIATRKGTQVHLMLEALVTRSLRLPVPTAEGVRPARDDLDRRIVDLNALGEGDSDIARITGYTAAAIFKRRSAMGLISPKKRGGQRK